LNQLLQKIYCIKYLIVEKFYEKEYEKKSFSLIEEERNKALDENFKKYILPFENAIEIA